MKSWWDYRWFETELNTVNWSVGNRQSLCEDKLMLFEIHLNVTSIRLTGGNNSEHCRYLNRLPYTILFKNIKVEQTLCSVNTKTIVHLALLVPSLRHSSVKAMIIERWKKKKKKLQSKQKRDWSERKFIATVFLNTEGILPERQSLMVLFFDHDSCPWIFTSKR